MVSHTSVFLIGAVAGITAHVILNRSREVKHDNKNVVHDGGTRGGRGGEELAKILGGERARVNALTSGALQWAWAHGLLVAHNEQESTLTNCPFALLPFRIPKQVYADVWQVSPLFNTVVDRVSRDIRYLQNVLKASAGSDTFIRNLLRIAEMVEKKTSTQALRLGIHRSDYMIDARNEASGVRYEALQVENNTIAASFACLSAQVSKLHSFMMDRYCTSVDKSGGALPKNLAPEGMADAMEHALRLVKQQHPSCREEWYVMFVVLEGETNIADQKMLEFQLWERHGVRVHRASLQHIAVHSELKEDVRGNKQLYVDDKLIGLVYFRAGYDPAHYDIEKKRDHTQDDVWEGEDIFLNNPQWGALLMMERSSAVKCPTAAYHLAGSKKIQQQLALEGELEKFVTVEEAARMRRHFAGLYPLGLGGSGGREADLSKRVQQDAIVNSSRYVLKPQREGGGNNLWGKEMVDMLTSASEEELSAYILMERIMPEPQHAVLVRQGNVIEGACLCEMGIYSAFIGDGKNVYRNRALGHLVRTKLETTDEGGVAAGYAVLNSPYLI